MDLSSRLHLALLTKWRSEAAYLRTVGLIQPATMAERFVAELETDTLAYELAALTLDEGVVESGYSYSSLQGKVASGELQNVGTKGSPRLIRRELPRKGGTLARSIADETLVRRLIDS